MSIALLAQNPFTFLLEHKQATSLLTGALAFVFALVILQTLRRFKVPQNDKWAVPFAHTFLILGLLHSLKPLEFLLGQVGKGWLLPSSAISLVFAAGSAATNYLFFRVGIPLSNKSGRLSSKIWRFVQEHPASVKYIHLTVIVLLSITAVIAWYGDLQIEADGERSGGWLWSRFADVVFSVPAIWFVGLALYRNISSRRVGRMAWFKWATLLAAITYCMIFGVYGAFPLIAAGDWDYGLAQADFADRLKALDAALIACSVPLKVGLFFSALTLILMIADPGPGIRKLLKSFTHGPEEFLDDEGVVRSLGEEIKASRVELYLTLPGRKEVARYMWPNTGGVAGRSEELQLNADDDCARVISTPETMVLRGVLNHPDMVPEGVRLREGAAVIAVPVLLHGATIGCLKAELDGGSFTEAELQATLRFAALLTPSAQNFRHEEMSKVLSHRLASFSHRLTNLQIRARGDYDIERDIASVAHIAHEILGPLTTGLYIRAGFRRHWACDSTDSGCCEAMKHRLAAPDAGVAAADDGKGHIFLPNELKVAWDEPGNDRSHEQPIGMLLLAPPSQSDQGGWPSTLVTNVFHSRVMLSLITDASLNFIRGSLNEVTRRLGMRMIRMESAGVPTDRANVPSWFETVDETAREAELLWAVAKYPDEQGWLGEQVGLVKELEGRKDLWRDKVREDEYAYANNLDIALCTLTRPRGELSHVIRISPRGSGQAIWLGVGNDAFDLELDYLSPWMEFVLRFGEIAHTNLKQILLKQKQEKLERVAADAFALATMAVAADTFAHQMVNQVRDLTAPMTMLADAVKRSRLHGNENHRKTILGLGESVSQIEALLKLFAGKSKADERRPCSLAEAYQGAFDLLRDSLARYDIKVNLINLDGQVVDVPFYVASHAVANLLNNAKDAIKDGGGKNGLIEVSVEQTETMILCHVTDNGPGVPPSAVEHLFETRGNSSKPHGSGLGLYLLAHSLRENRGDIKVTSPGPHPPTTFTLFFPRQRKD